MRTNTRKVSERDSGPPPESLIRRIKMSVANGVLGPEYGSVLGVMKIRKDLTESEYDAAVWYSNLRASYLRAIDAKALKGQNVEASWAGNPPDPDSPAGRRTTDREKSVIEKHTRAYRAIRECGREACNAFMEYVVSDGEVDKDQPSYLVRANIKLVCRALRQHREAFKRNRQREKV